MTYRIHKFSVKKPCKIILGERINLLRDTKTMQLDAYKHETYNITEGLEGAIYSPHRDTQNEKPLQTTVYKETTLE